MRVVLVLGLVALAGCGSTPQSLAITGPGVPTVGAPGADDSAIPPPGISNGGGSYRYNLEPTQSENRFFNYN